MPRASRLPSVPFGWYYVYRSAQKNRRIVTNKLELAVFRQMLASTVVKSGLKLHFAHVDETELHLGVQAGSGAVSKELGKFFERFADDINRRRGETGSLFREHAHILLVQPGKWLLALGRWIHWLPQLKSADSSGLYYWNTEPFYRNRRTAKGLHTTVVFRMLTGGSRKLQTQEQAYRKFFDQCPATHEVELFKRGSPQDVRIVGDPQFISRVCRELPAIPVPRRVDDLTAQTGLEEVATAVVENFRSLCQEQLPPAQRRKWMRDVSLERLRSLSRTQPLPMLRALCASLLVTGLRLRLRYVERFLNCRPKTLRAGRREQYQVRFREIFGQSYECLNSPSAVEAPRCSDRQPRRDDFATRL